MTPTTLTVLIMSLMGLTSLLLTIYGRRRARRERSDALNAYMTNQELRTVLRVRAEAVTPQRRNVGNYKEALHSKVLGRVEDEETPRRNDVMPDYFSPFNTLDMGSSSFDSSPSSDSSTPDVGGGGDFGGGGSSDNW